MGRGDGECECGDLSAAQQTMKLSVASVEMTIVSLGIGRKRRGAGAKAEKTESGGRGDCCG